MAVLAAEDVDSFISEAESKGMYLVDDKSCGALLEEYKSTLIETELLCSTVDDASEPYKSKYKARTMLDALMNKLEATRTIAAVEGKKSRMADMDWRIASARVKLGVISWECEEPHNAQTDLELAIQYYIPQFVEAVLEIVGPDSPETEEDQAAAQPVKPTDKLVPPQITATAILREQKVDAMKCLNMLGILWAGRGHVQKSFLYLLAAKNLYDLDTGKVYADVNELESAYTHNLFYLAQAYGQIGDVMKSSEFCYETLQRQLVGGFTSPRVALDWAKNCASISDFYKSMNHIKRCVLALASAEAVLRAGMQQQDEGGDQADDDELRNTLAEITASINVRWVALDVLVLKRSFDRETKRRHLLDIGADPVPEEEADDKLDNDHGAAAIATSIALARISGTESVLAFSSGCSDQGVVEFFGSLPVSSVPFLGTGEVTSFEHARTVFMRASSRLDAAKKHFLLDGYVTDHVNLLQDHSRLYHYLALFEPDYKRKLAMETRRIDMLQPLLKMLNKAAYEGLHKQLSYELGETYMSLLELKAEKVRAGACGADEKSIKKADSSKINSYAHGSLAMFTNYLSYFARVGDLNARGGSKPFAEMSLHELFAIEFTDPDESLLTDEEMRAYLNAHFYACRIVSKVIAAPDSSPQDRAQPLTVCLRRYEWLRSKAPGLCNRKGVDVADVFRNEMEIIEEMVRLLPPKIDRVFFRGESSML